jgi:fatty acid desaturase
MVRVSRQDSETRRGVLRYSKMDLVPLSVVTLQLLLNIWIAVTWERLGTLELVLLWICSVLLLWYNLVIATHNFLHTPWFTGDLANRVFAGLNSINLGLPQILYRYQHLRNHHRFENDRRTEDSECKDRSSTYAYGKNGRHENVVVYCALLLFRSSTSSALRDIRDCGQVLQFCIQLGICLIGLGAFLVLSWPFAVFFYLPSIWGGWFCAGLETYYEHFGANPNDRFANSVSYYGRIYNALLCNEGYHQEHHLRPGWHWTRRPAVRAEFLAEITRAGMVVSQYPPIVGFFDRQRGSGEPRLDTVHASDHPGSFDIDGGPNSSELTQVLRH